VNTFSSRVRHSPPHAFHGALHQAHNLKTIDSMLNLSPERKKQIARSILSAWQRSGDDSGAKDLVYSLMEEGISNKIAEATADPPSS
jgi:hypothetical protein